MRNAIWNAEPERFVRADVVIDLKFDAVDACADRRPVQLGACDDEPFFPSSTGASAPASSNFVCNSIGSTLGSPVGPKSVRRSRWSMPDVIVLAHARVDEHARLDRRWEVFAASIRDTLLLWQCRTCRCRALADCVGEDEGVKAGSEGILAFDDRIEVFAEKWSYDLRRQGHV